jgi:hypothetical protein
MGDGLSFGYNPGWGTSNSGAGTAQNSTAKTGSSSEQFTIEVNSAGPQSKGNQSAQNWNSSGSGAYAFKPPVDGNLGEGYGNSPVRTTPQFTNTKDFILGR